MQCPVCKVDLVMSERQGVEIDYCPKCRGVWLDRGELDKIIERSSLGTMAPETRETNYQKAPRVSYDNQQRTSRYGHNDHGNNDERGGFRKKKKEGFLADLFDFGD